MPTVIADKGTRFNIPLTDFSGGINNSQSDEDIEDNQLSSADNYLPEFPGSRTLRKRVGATAVSDSQSDTEDVQLIYQGKHNTYFCTNTILQQSDGTDITTGLTTSTTYDATTFADRDIFVNGTEEIYSTNGTSSSALGGTPPSGKYIETHNNFLFMAGHSLGALRWADLGTTETWTATNSITIDTDEDDDITGLKKFRDVLMVFTEKRFFLVNGFATVDMEIVRSVHEGPGCISGNSIVVTNAGIFWWSDEGLVFSDDGITTDLPMQRKLRGTLDSLTSSASNIVHGAWNPMEQRVEYFVADGSQLDTCIYYYYLEDAFYLGTGVGCRMTASATVDVSGLPTVYVGGYGDGADKVYSRTGVTDDSTTITANMETKRVAPGGSPTALIKVEDVTLHTGPLTASDTITLGVYIDDETSANPTYGLSVITTRADDKVGLSRRCSKIKVRIEDSDANGRPEIRGATLRGYVLSD